MLILTVNCFFSDPKVLISPISANESFITPPQETQPSTSGTETNENNKKCPLMSPVKKIKLSHNEDDQNQETLEDETVTEPLQLKYLTAEGHVEFHRQSQKKYQKETKWQRPVKLHLGYTYNSIKDCTIYLVIYEGNLTCRRNLLKEFEKSDATLKHSAA